MKNPYEQFYKNKLTKIFYPESLVVKLFALQNQLNILNKNIREKNFRSWMWKWKA